MKMAQTNYIHQLSVEISTGSHLSLRFQGCAGCKSPPSVPPAAPFDVEIHEMELCSVLKAQEEGAGGGKKNLSETAMDEARPEDEEEEEEVEQKGTKTQDGNQGMTAEEQRVTSEAAEAETPPPESDMTH